MVRRLEGELVWHFVEPTTKVAVHTQKPPRRLVLMAYLTRVLREEHV